MLHIINKSPTERNSLSSCLAVARPGATLLLIEDAVYAATDGSAAAQMLRTVRERLTVCILRPDLEARGMVDRVIEGVELVDYAGFVDLVAECKNCQTWL
jgi:tRNA 2-thiouridine synthesizing protein B